MPSTKRVLVVGAGLGGLTAALALLQRGFDVEVFEQAHELGEVGAGVQIGPNGSCALFALGLRDQLMALAFEPVGKEIRLWNTGQRWRLFDLGAQSIQLYGYPYVMMHRADLHSVLVDAVRQLKPDSIRLGAKVDSFTQEPNRVSLRLQDGRLFAGDILIGADGLHSRIRTGLLGPRKARFTGGVVWRGVVPIAQLPDALRRPVGANWVGPHGHVITYPVRRGELMNFAGHVERDDWQVESWTERGTTAECLSDYEGWSDEVRGLIAAIDAPFRWALFLHEPAERWSHGRVTLLGDACHAMVPYLAQGANIAIEDGLVLGRCLAGFAIDEGLARYEMARRERATRVVRSSANNLEIFHNRNLGDPREAAHYVDTEWEPEKVKARYEWLFTYNAATVPI